MSRSLTRSNSDYLAAASALGVTAPPFSVSLWCWPTNLSDPQTLWVVRGATDHAHYLHLRANLTGDPVSASSLVGVSLSNALSSGGVTGNAWNHVGGVWQSTTSRSVYLSGGKDTNSDSRSPSGINVMEAGRFSLSNAHFDGRLAEIGVWSTALTDAEMASLAAGASPRMVRPQSLVEYWPLVGRDSPEPGKKGNDFTVNGTPVAADHPPIYR